MVVIRGFSTMRRNQHNFITHSSSYYPTNTTKVDEYFTTHSLPTPSFNASAGVPRESPIPASEPAIQAARQSVIQDTLELHQLMLGPREHIFSYSPTHLVSQLAIARFGLARIVPIDGEATFAEIAKVTGLGETHVRKLIRHAISQHVFQEPRPGVVTHSAASRLLAEDADLAAWARWCADDCWLAAYYTCEAMARWPGSEEPNETGFAVANQTDLPMFDFLATQPERGARFAAGMRLYAARPDLNVQYLVDAWSSSWGSLPKGATVVDVGGSHGEAAIALARAYPSLNLVVQDIDAPTIRDAYARKPANISERVRYMTHDFFTEQPIHGADVYLYRACFHNWSDKYAIRMLQALIPALKPGARVVLNDVIVPSPKNMPPGSALGVRSGDLSMTMLFNAGDREMADWARLFEAASSGFHFDDGKQPPGSGLWVLVATWNGV
ncbi:S-adenosyl-L-methionine-dependent methyltransferase [Hypoxylon trugodes]|uniref:S-adenosyl-L-methionine-dependent methyltransferase n=1 Tax=Hypoxylon trugodes TaxID=326681 RepID=UPI002194B7FB|nr:S-adenosyl-L-methionine-dependent methyltransferase [Hypoxylon trugodes]KAI1391387.1 S-adenosyl-L-methionine-dependent methyltransferase [Hypoxylon trugodes]